MEKRNPLEKSRYINERYKEYLRSSFSLGETRLQELFEEQLESEDLFKGPFLDLSLPFRRGKSLRELIDEGVIAGSFLRLGSVDFDRPLYSHQERAIHRIGAGHNVVITTGTGSGKTEAFLYPILNELLLDIESGNDRVGIRALFLYPMNALVNDQISRLRGILQECPEITFGFFTGDTPETASQTYRDEYSAAIDAVIPPNEILSREEIRKRPPHLLFTNYSMLEYLLIRPNDYAVFSPERLLDWKYVVLDEAHSYSGSLGIEISYLMRRLTALADCKPRFILSSATLGRKGKSEEDIVSFASKLTSSVFTEEDIIFDDRVAFVLPRNPINLKDDYQRMHADHASIAEVGAKNGLSVSGKSDREILYDLLVNDENVERLYEILRDGSKDVHFIRSQFSELDEPSFVALIDLINYAEKDGIGLFSLKYHSFVRSLAGAFISLAAPPSLSLMKTNQIDGNKAFEIGNCRYCNTPFIIGKVVQDHKTGLCFLIQNDEVDIYENYGDNEGVIVDYFLFEDAVEKSEIDSAEVEKCIVCSVCGMIAAAENLNAVFCECADAKQINVYRVLTHSKDDRKSFNNLNSCPCCGRTSQAGIVKSLNLGKDETTAILAQTLLESLDSTDPEIKKKPLSLSLGLRSKSALREDEGAPAVKQFLAFSDSRSQASYFAAFFDANQSRMLRRRLIWKVLEENEYRVMTTEELESKLEVLIRNGNLFDNNMSAYKNAWVTILVELLCLDGRNSCEGHGLYHFEIDLSPILSQFKNEEVADAFGEYGFSTLDDLASILQAVYYSFAVDYAVAGLSNEEKLEYLPYRGSFEAVELRSSKSRDGVRSLLPMKNKDNKLLRYIVNTFGCNLETAEKIVVTLFDLGVDSGLFEKDNSLGAYRIKADRFVLKNYRNTAYYRCSKCGGITPHNVHGVCMSNKCDGHLEEIDPDVDLKSDFYRIQYKTKAVERLVVKEHTAQLKKEAARQYQSDFKSKKINVLSCSTTFEMGVDIGGLETVFMRNVPPTPANYVQRAGRAGRRADSTAYILTYCGSSSHDYTYFVSPEKMISGIINPPFFDVLNGKVIRRHLMAASLGFFFRSNPGYYASIQELVFNGGLDAFRRYVSDSPLDLVTYIDEKMIPDEQYARFHGMKWFLDMGCNDEKLQQFEDAMQSMLSEYEEAKEKARASEDYYSAKYFDDQIGSLKEARVIDKLSEYCVIPKYGFPIDVVNLDVYEDGHLQRGYDLSRDLRIGISEYAPGSEVIVDKKKYTSSFITLPKGSSLPQRFFCKCSKCEKINVAVVSGSLDSCHYCGESLESQKIDYFLEPVHGFKTGKSKKSSYLKPKRSYAGEVSYLGGGVSDGSVLDLGGLLSAETTSNDELLVMNKSLFYYCEACGFSEVLEKGAPTPKRTKKHQDCRGWNCGNDQLISVRLGHRFQTDVARLTIPMLSISGVHAFPEALSFMYAFLEGMCIALEIERTDLNALLEKNYERDCFDILIYDDVPGGAGLVKRLMSKEAILSSMREGLWKVSQSCCDEETSCYNCLRNYYNQSFHGSLKRKYAKELLEVLVPEVEDALPSLSERAV